MSNCKPATYDAIECRKKEKELMALRYAASREVYLPNAAEVFSAFMPEEPNGLEDNNNECVVSD